jgi:hypothetical protein
MLRYATVLRLMGGRTFLGASVSGLGFVYTYLGREIYARSGEIYARSLLEIAGPNGNEVRQAG